jgi:hypothetical protein
MSKNYILSEAQMNDLLSREQVNGGYLHVMLRSLPRVENLVEPLPSDKVAMSVKPLRELLTALNGPGHHIRELQFTRGPLVGKDNPINILCTEFNAAMEARRTGETKERVNG